MEKECSLVLARALGNWAKGSKFSLELMIMFWNEMKVVARKHLKCLSAMILHYYENFMPIKKKIQNKSFL